MPVDPRTPVIVGVATRTRRAGELPGPEPLVAWEEVCRTAFDDAGCPDALARIGSVGIANCRSWRYDDPTRMLLARLGADASRRRYTRPSGTSGQVLLNAAAQDIREGAADVAVVCGGESLATLRRLRATGTSPSWTAPRSACQDTAFKLSDWQHPSEAAVGLADDGGAVRAFALLDTARRAHLGLSAQRARELDGELLAGMTRVAAANPHAWFREPATPEQLTTPGSQNRRIAYPYTKRMVAIMEVDIAAALVVMSEAEADRVGVPRRRRVYPWVSCYAEDPLPVVVREPLWASSAMGAASAAVLRSAGLTIDAVKYRDLYSCFPSAVNFACDALGIEDRRGEALTVTGGLPYAGGPASSFVVTSIARMVETLRSDPESFGLVSGLGMLLAQHVYALYSTRPPDLVAPPMADSELQVRLDARPRRQIDPSYVGPAVVAGYTIVRDRNDRARGIAVCDLPDGSRACATFEDEQLLDRGDAGELVEADVELRRGQQSLELARPSPRARSFGGGT